MTYEQLQRFAESLMTWLIQDRLAAGLISAALVLVMLALALRWTLRKPVTREHDMPAVASALAADVQLQPVQPVQPASASAAEAGTMAPAAPVPDALPARLELLAGEVSSLRRQLADTEALLRRQADKVAFMERQQLLQPNTSAASDGAEDDVRQAGYEQAMMLAAHGVPVQELMAQCGLTRPEAQLIVLLHGRGGQA